MTARATIGSNDRSRGPLPGNYATLPAKSILTRDDPSVRDDMATDTFAAIGFGVGALCIVGGLIYLATI